MIRKFDLFILALFQMASWKLERFFGRTNFFFAAICSGIVFLALLLGYVPEYYRVGDISMSIYSGILSFAVLTITIVAVVFSELWDYSVADDREWDNILKDLQGFMLIRSIYLIYYVLFVPLLLVVGAYHLALLGGLCSSALYFVSCMPLQTKEEKTHT